MSPLVARFRFFPRSLKFDCNLFFTREFSQSLVPFLRFFTPRIYRRSSSFSFPDFFSSSTPSLRLLRPIYASASIHFPWHACELCSEAAERRNSETCAFFLRPLQRRKGMHGTHRETHQHLRNGGWLSRAAKSQDGEKRILFTQVNKRVDETLWLCRSYDPFALQLLGLLTEKRKRQQRNGNWDPETLLRLSLIGLSANFDAMVQQHYPVVSRNPRVTSRN